MKLIFIGGGPAGYVGALRGAQLGAEVILIEQEKVGGTCLNEGCIPTKAYFHDAKIYKEAKSALASGVFSGDIAPVFEKIKNRKDEVVQKLVGGTEMLLKKAGVTIIQGTASFEDDHTLKVLTNQEMKTLKADAIFISTGSESIIPPIPGADLPGILYSKEALALQTLPQSMIVLGGGVIALELACIFQALGTEVTLVARSSLLKKTDGEIAKRLPLILKKQGLKVLLDSQVSQISAKDHQFFVSVQGKKEAQVLSSEKVLLALGRAPYAKNLQVEKAGLSFEKALSVNENYQTAVPHIYAIGDVNGNLLLAHAASHQAICAVEHCLLQKKAHPFVVPDCVFIQPEIASVGETEETLKAKEIPYLKSKFPFSANGKAMTMNAETGFVKILAHSESKKILGIHIWGEEASSLIHEGALLIQNQMDYEAIIHTIHAHPSLAEAFHEAALGLENRSLHMM